MVTSSITPASRWGTRLVVDHGRFVRDHHDAPVACDQPVLRIERLAGQVAALLGDQGLGAVVGMYEGVPEPGSASHSDTE